MTQRVFVLDSDGEALMPAHPARARRLLRGGRARVARQAPFTIQLCDRKGGNTQAIEAKYDPGSRVTGIALVALFERRGWSVTWAGELTHRSQAIRQRLTDRPSYRRGRKARFANRRRPAGWLAPSLRSRVEQTQVWHRRLAERAPISAIAVETARFDVSAMTAERPLKGVEYQQGTLAGWELREYLLHWHGHTCAYCQGGSRDPVLELDHVQPRGGAAAPTGSPTSWWRVGRATGPKATARPPSGPRAWPAGATDSAGAASPVPKAWPPANGRACATRPRSMPRTTRSPRR